MNYPSINEVNEWFKNTTNFNLIKHCENCAFGAKLISERLNFLDPELAFIMGLIHDIGKLFNTNRYSHLIIGYKFLLENGYDKIARICITHAFPIKTVFFEKNNFNNPEDYEFLKNYLYNIEYDDYDRLIQLADCFSIPDGFCLIEKRFVQASLKYGTSNLTYRKWEKIIQIKKYFEEKINCSIYDILPNVVQNTFK